MGFWGKPALLDRGLQEQRKAGSNEEEAPAAQEALPHSRAPTVLFLWTLWGKGMPGPAIPELFPVATLACRGSPLALCWSPPRTLGYSVDNLGLASRERPRETTLCPCPAPYLGKAPSSTPKESLTQDPCLCSPLS